MVRTDSELSQVLSLRDDNGVEYRNMPRALSPIVSYAAELGGLLLAMRACAQAGRSDLVSLPLLICLGNAHTRSQVGVDKRDLNASLLAADLETLGETSSSRLAEEIQSWGAAASEKSIAFVENCTLNHYGPIWNVLFRLEKRILSRIASNVSSIKFSITLKDCWAVYLGG